MSIQALINQQKHKARDGYYINHDNLMLANEQDRKKLIFYFIASQVSEKLNPTDRLKFYQEKVHNIENWIGFFASTLFVLRAPVFGSRLNQRYLYNFIYHGLGATFNFYLFQSLSHHLLEGEFVNNNQILTDLTTQYNFSIYDFAQAKKESHLKQIRRELADETNRWYYSS